jgi:hypothetical protein
VHYGEANEPGGIDTWHEDGSFWQAFGVGPSKVLGLMSRRYDDIERKLKDLLVAATDAFFWPSGEQKMFTKGGGKLTLIPEGDEGGGSEEGIAIIPSVASLKYRFQSFRKRAILTGKVKCRTSDFQSTQAANDETRAAVPQDNHSHRGC